MERTTEETRQTALARVFEALTDDRTATITKLSQIHAITTDELCRAIHGDETNEHDTTGQSTAERTAEAAGTAEHLPAKDEGRRSAGIQPSACDAAEYRSTDSRGTQPKPGVYAGTHGGGNRTEKACQILIKAIERLRNDIEDAEKFFSDSP